MDKIDVRSGIWTHAHICGPEFSQQILTTEAMKLESGALDHKSTPQRNQSTLQLKLDSLEREKQFPN